MKKAISCLLLGLLLWSLTGCGGEQKEVQAVCDAFFEAYQQGDNGTAAQSLGILGAGLKPGPIQSALAGKLSVKVQKAEADGETATADVRITNVDMEAVLRELPDEIDSIEAAREALLSRLEEENVPKKEFEVEVRLRKNSDGGWFICMTPELSDALLGGYYSMLDELMEEAGL